ncbi:MAG TPA: SDR family NAD(P)-dependent oxidoreductase [Acidimicrobiales bacterium]|nr:SDR family NAD(P)-dependent oxidoreductase [Acidimicrobiales bacterium]
MVGRVQGRVALVTGAGSSGPGVGIGKAISVVLGREGASVLLVDNVKERAEDTLRMVEQAGGKAEVFVADISRSADSEAMVRAAVDQFGGLDILVNNAAITAHQSITETSPELYESVMAVNLRGAFLACKFAAQPLISRGGGSIVNIGSIAGVRDSGMSQPAYSSSKAALLGLTVDLAGCLGHNNVRVNAVLPGIIATPMQAEVLRAYQEADSSGVPVTADANLLGRRGDAWDVAHAVLFLSSDEGSYITGATLPVDGGAIAAMPTSYLLRSNR